jgi:hypothetical protein
MLFVYIKIYIIEYILMGGDFPMADNELIKDWKQKGEKSGEWQRPLGFI